MEKKKKHYNEWSKRDFQSLPRPDNFWNNIGEVDSLIIIPTRRKHDSGYRCMEFAAIQNGEPTYLLSGCSDVIHFGGGGGYNVFGGDIKKYAKRVKEKIGPINDWIVDCLPVSGLLRITCRHKIIVGASVSSFDIYFKEEL